MNHNPDTSIEREREIFLEALARTTGAERGVFLDGACGNDAALRVRVESLLRHHSEDNFLEEPAVAGEPVICESVGAVIGRYKLLQKIGEGGMGVVYMAGQEEPVRRKVALKVIKLGMDTKQVVARFEAERQALALMDHPNIAKVLDGGATETGRPYFVMELVQGVPITEYCDKNQLPAQERIQLFILVCQAIQSAHQKGIIHRDLKPTNILVTFNAGVPHPMVIDFGVAKATNQKLTEKTVFTNYATMIGTPAYMSPEQAEMSRLDVDTRSDIYGLGVLLYELLTGTTPFPEKRLRSASYQEMQRIIMEEEPERPSTRLRRKSAEPSAGTQSTSHSLAAKALATAAALSTDLDWIVMKCLEKDRARRYETANGLAADLQRHLDNEPVVARPPSTLYRLQKLVRRNKLAFAAGAMVALALLVGMALAAWQAVRASRERDAKELALREQTRLRSEAETAQQQARADARRAEAAAGEVRMTLAASDFGEARRLIGSGDAADAVPYLSRILSTDPANFAALSQLATLLTYHSWMVPTLSLKHEDYATSAQFSPDGKRILTASWDHTARVWDAATGQPLVERMRQGGHIGARFSPDGRRIVTASDDGAARVWDAQTGQPLTQLLQHKGRLEWAEFSPDSARIVTASDDGTARVWDAQTGKLLTEVKHQDNVLCARFSPDGKRIVTASRDNTARVWDAQTGHPLTAPLQHGLWVQFAEFSPDGKRVLTASTDNTARLWDAQTGQPLAQPLTHQDHVWSARFSPDGKRIVTASADNTARVWDAQTGLPVTEPLRHEARVMFARFSPDGRRVVSASEDNTARIWDAQTGQLLAELRHGGPVYSAEFSPDDKRIVTVSLDNTARVWDAPIAGAIGQSLGEGTRAQFSADGKRLVTASASTARVWDAKTGQPLTPPLENDNTVYDAQFSPDGNRVVTASGGGTAQVWDAQTGQPLTGPLKHETRIYTSQFSPDGARILTASWDNTARVWDAQTGQLLIELLGHTGRVNAAHYSPDGQRVATASQDGTARIWDAQTGQLLTQPLKHDYWVMSVQFSPDGKHVLTASGDNTARVWDAQTGQPLAGPLRHSGLVWSAQFSPDGMRVVTASIDKTARVWDAQTGQPLTGPLKHRDQVWFARFSPDGRRIVTTVPIINDDWMSGAQFSPDGNRIVTVSSAAQIWDAQSGQPLTEPLKYENATPLPSGADGKRIEFRVQGGAARLWDVGFVPSKLPDWLLLVAEAISGQRLNKQGILEETTLDRAKTIAQIRQDLNVRPGAEDGVSWGRWLLSDPANRTMSPFSTTGLYDYIEAQIKEQTEAAENEALQLLSGGGDLSQRISGLCEWLPLAYGNHELSQRILDARDQLEQTSFLCTNGVARARAGQWTNAVEDFSKLCQLYPNEAWYHHFLAVLQAQLGDVEGYSRHRARMLATYGATNDPGAGDLIGKACLILPLTGIELDTAARLADTAVTKGAGSENHTWFELCKGLAEYRQGHFASAVDWMQKVLAAPGIEARSTAAWAVIAMAQQQSGKVSEARAALDKGAEVVKTKLPALESGDIGDGWNDWIIAHLLMKEAKGLIEGPISHRQ